KTILATGDTTLAEFKKRGGVVTTLSGSAKAEFGTIMTNKVLPKMKGLFEPEVLAAAQKFVK
ncbi:MAG: hypothetical protein ACR2O1_01875, partial [Boseongicola sp.]